MWKKSEGMWKRRSVQEGTVLLSPIVWVFSSQFFLAQKIIVRFCSDPTNFGGITPGAKRYGEQHPAVENRNSDVPAWSFQVCYVHTPSYFPTTEGIRKLTCCARGGILACFDHGENLSLKAKLTGDENSHFSEGASPVPQSLLVSESWCGLLYPTLHNGAVWIVRSARC